jgi:hypothetical protein
MPRFVILRLYKTSSACAALAVKADTASNGTLAVSENFITHHVRKQA